ncbi:hypothetical protein [Mongoliimonas terrestris]|uniref:hypothetical protein n=1 Tax=Mongoliimonas terrestris TaxID=1709001 RepID=UPI000949A85F|nr:hypothetical protein [Mongoliimonas terrestris]
MSETSEAVRTAIVAADGAVVNVTLVDPAATFAPAPGHVALPCPDAVAPGWRLEAGAFVPPEDDPEPAGSG